MKKPDHVREIYLYPGEFYFGDQNSSIRTLIGSCVSVVMWHPTRLIGGMCHYMLPFHLGKDNKLDGRYAEDAMQMFSKEVLSYGTTLQEYVIKVFGGASVFPGNTQKMPCRCGILPSREGIMACSNVACKNISVIHLLAKQYDLQITAQHMGGDNYRNLIFDIWSGEIRMKNGH